MSTDININKLIHGVSNQTLEEQFFNQLDVMTEDEISEEEIENLSFAAVKPRPLGRGYKADFLDDGLQ